MTVAPRCVLQTPPSPGTRQRADAGGVTGWVLPHHLAVVSADGHPISGPLSFVVGTAATASSTTPGTTARTEPTEPAAPWPVITIRLAGFVAFAVITGVAAFVLLCAPTSSKNFRLQFLVHAGLMGGAGATGTRPIGRTVRAAAVLHPRDGFSAGIGHHRHCELITPPGRRGPTVAEPLRAHADDQACAGCSHSRGGRSLTTAVAAAPSTAAVSPDRGGSDGCILLVTALLSTTAPPAHAAESNTHTDHAAQLANGTVMMSLGDRGKAGTEGPTCYHRWQPSALGPY
jgi:hypothetical protein